MQLPPPPPLPRTDLSGNVLPPAVLGSRELFPDLAAPIYLNHAAVSPPSRRVQAAIGAWAHDLGSRGVDAFSTWMSQRDRLRGRLGRMLGVPGETLALTAGTTRGVLDIAWCVDWRPGDRVVLFDGEFPANVTPWLQAARHFDLQPVFLPVEGAGWDDGSGRGLARLEATLRDGARMVAVSAVQFQTGLAMPLGEMAALCHAHGAELFVDGIQAAGMKPLDLAALGVDYLSSGGHKWLMGVEGCGLLYIAPAALARLVPRMAGWLSHEEGTRFLFEGKGHLKADRPIRQRADFLEVGASPSVGMAGLEAAVSDLEALGIETIFAHVQAWHDRVEPALVARGFRSLRATDPAGRSGSLCVEPPPDVDLLALFPALTAAGVSAATPDGRLRLAPHWPNSLDEAPRVLAAVDTALAAVRGG